MVVVCRLRSRRLYRTSPQVGADWYLRIFQSIRNTGIGVVGVEEVHRKLQCDFTIKYFSPLLDLLIVFRTVKTMLTVFGSR
jgi:hypothetical protein